jgi:hypothetical protein
METNNKLIPEDFLEVELEKEGTISNFHHNDGFLRFWDTYFPEIKETKKAQKKFTYFANKLVNSGIAEKTIKFSLGRGSMNEFGARTQTIWNKA